MLTKKYSYSCPAIGVRVVVTRQTLPAIACIGDVAGYSQSDYDCSHQDQCERRHDQACAVYRLNTGGANAHS
ncbi:hypothetical protein [Massilia soli]|uniref:Uncharacterized protein n=1 Tax=Massilia soli TaxID=2792854 RepID=A0ABS7SKB6_9BURK|nr:hypothetical protein [Massilia soli]MBZ2206564.1 hypothetical protein [Massilia soli]